MKRDNGKHYIHPNFNIHAAENLGKTIEALTKKNQNIFDLPFCGSQHSIECYIERAVIAGVIAAIIKELQINDAFLQHFRDFSQIFRTEFSLYAHDLSPLLSNNTQAHEVLIFEKEQGISAYFIEFQKRLPDAYLGVLSQDLIKHVLIDNIYKRAVEPNLELMNIVDINYSAGLEDITKKMQRLRILANTKKTSTIEHV